MKKQIILVFAIIIYGALQAQETGNYLDFNVGGGIHNLSYSLLNGTEKGQFGYTINAGYSYFFTPQWGLHTGLGFQSFQSLSTLNYLSTTPEIDSEGQSFLFKANYKNWQERQTALFIEIPLTVQFKLPIAPKFGLLASAGGKISVPFNTTYKSVGGEIVTTGYYSKYNVELSGMPQHGFSTYTNNFTGNISLKTSCMAIADLGGLYKLNDKTNLYVGGYINYGLNNIYNTQNKSIYQYNSSSNNIYNGLLSSTQTSIIHPISFGLKVGVYWHLGQNKSSLDFNKPGETLSITPVTPVDSVVSGTAVKPVEPGITLEPVKPLKPAEPVQTVQPTVPVQSVTTTETEQAAKPEQPLKPVEAVQSAKTVEPLTATEPVQFAKTVQPLKMTEPVQIAKPVETVQRPIDPIPSVETEKTANPVESVQLAVVPIPSVETAQTPQPTEKVKPVHEIQPTEPAKSATPVLEVIAVDHTPKGTVTSKEAMSGQPDKTNEQPESLQNDDAYDRAKIIAASINIMFGFNSTKVTTAKNDKIKELSDILKANSYIHLRFVGHTDNIGSHKINVIFGMRRADNVKQKFIDQGVSRSQLISESKAYDEPLAPNTSSPNRAKNRRVEIKVYK